MGESQTVDQAVLLAAYHMSVEQLRAQSSDLSNLRNQASFTGAVSGIIATVFASVGQGTVLGKMTEDPVFLSVGLVPLLLLVVFSGSIVFSVMVVVSWRTCVFDLEPLWMIGRSEGGASEGEILMQIVEDAEKYYKQNENVIAEVRQYFWWAAVLSVVQIPLWVMTILG